jgi:hypothetical protein
MRLQITFDKKTHPQGLPVYQNPKLKTGKPKGPFYEKTASFGPLPGFLFAAAAAHCIGGAISGDRSRQFTWLAWRPAHRSCFINAGLFPRLVKAKKMK